MSSKKKGNTGKVPAGNRPQSGPSKGDLPHGAPLSDHDSKRRLGNYATAGEHAFVQPGGKNDADR